MYLVSLQSRSPYFQVWLMSFITVAGIVIQQTVRSLNAMLIINRLRAVRACELRTTTQHTLKFVKIPTIINVLKWKNILWIMSFEQVVEFWNWSQNLKYWFTFCFLLDPKEGWIALQYFYLNHPTFCIPRRRPKKI